MKNSHKWISHELAVDGGMSNQHMHSCYYAPWRDCFFVDGRLKRKLRRRVAKRKTAIKIACSYTVTRHEIADNLYSTKETTNGISQSNRRQFDGLVQELPDSLQKHLLQPPEV
jgi:hypothetical protein